MMTCRQARKLLGRGVNGPEREQWDSHLAACERCARWQRELQTVTNLAVALPVPEQDPRYWSELARTIRARVAAGAGLVPARPAPVPAVWPRRAALAFATAGGVLLFGLGLAAGRWCFPRTETVVRNQVLVKEVPMERVVKVPVPEERIVEVPVRVEVPVVQWRVKKVPVVVYRDRPGQAGSEAAVQSVQPPSDTERPPTGKPALPPQANRPPLRVYAVQPLPEPELFPAEAGPPPWADAVRGDGAGERPAGRFTTAVNREVLIPVPTRGW